MAALTEDQLALARLDLGTAVDEDDLQTRYDRLLLEHEPAEALTLATLEVLRQRKADLLADPAQFNTPDYGQNTTKNIDAIDAKIAELGAAAGVGTSVVRVVPPAAPTKLR